MHIMVSYMRICFISGSVAINATIQKNSRWLSSVYDYFNLTNVVYRIDHRL